MGSLKIGVALWSLGATPDEAALREKLETAAKIGLKAVQPWCVDGGPQRPCVPDPDRCVGEQRAAMRKLIESYGLTISGFCAQLGGPSGLGGLRDREGVEARIDKTKKALELAADLGGPIVTTHPGAIPEDPTDPMYQTLLESIGEIGRHGQQVGARFAIETGQEPAEVLRAFLERLGLEQVTVNYDPANMLKHGTVAGVKVLGDWIVHTHAKDRHPETRKPTVGQGAVPWDEYVAALKSIGYDGWYAIEDESGAEDVVESIRMGKEFLERY